MGQLISILRNWFCPKKKNETPKNNVCHYQPIIYVDDEHQCSHKIDIPDHATSVTKNVDNYNINVDPSTCDHDVVVDLNDEFKEVVSKKSKRKKNKEAKNKCDQLIDSLSHVTHQVSSVGQIGQYRSNQRILLVGEGDFSFSASLAMAFGNASNITATSLNSKKFLNKNYAMFPTNKAELESRGSLVLHGVDATTMLQHQILGSMVFDRIIFNFPHAGRFGHGDTELQAHQKLIKGFLKNAKKMIEEGGEIHITSKSNGFYLNWDIPKLGSDHKLVLVQEITFRSDKYPGYNTKYGFGGDRDFACDPSKTYKFGLSAK